MVARSLFVNIFVLTTVMFQSVKDKEYPKPETTGWAGEIMPAGMRRGEVLGEYVWERDGSIMVFVAAGQFVMGTDNRFPDQKPAHKVTLKAFYIDKYEVSRAQFRKFCAQTKYETEAERNGWGHIVRPNGFHIGYGNSWKDPGFPQEDSHPVVLVSWNDAEAYCSWAKKRLPTEAQWEKAASWEITKGEGHKRSYPWGDSEPAGYGAGRAVLIKFANLADVRWGKEVPSGDFSKTSLLNPEFGGKYDDGYLFTAPVGSYPDGASPCGALDMCGNVEEWCRDSYSTDFYARSPNTEPLNTTLKAGRTFRGGAYNSLCIYPTPTTHRQSIPADMRYSTIGFRTVVLP